MINKSLSQQGSTHVVIIVILVAALIGTLGFVFWQNFMNNKTVSSNADSTKNENKQEDTNSSAKTSDKLILEDWNIQFTIPNGLQKDEISYYKETTTGDTGASEHYEFTTKRVEALGERCIVSNDDSYAIRLALFSRSKDSNSDSITYTGTPINNGNPILGSYYYYGHSQSACSANNTMLQTDDTLLLMKMLKTGSLVPSY